MKLTAKQRQFVEEYLVDCNGKQAAIRAGYSARSAAVASAENLTKPNVAAALRAAFVKRTKRVQITQDWILSKLVENVERSMAAGNYQGSIANRALELLGKHLGLFVERIEHSGPAGGPIPITTEVIRERLADRLSGLASRISPPAPATNGAHGNGSNGKRKNGTHG